MIKTLQKAGIEGTYPLKSFWTHSSGLALVDCEFGVSISRLDLYKVPLSCKKQVALSHAHLEGLDTELDSSKFEWNGANRRRKWQSTPVFLPGKFHGQRSLADYSPWVLKELDMTERLTNTHMLLSIAEQNFQCCLDKTSALPPSLLDSVTLSVALAACRRKAAMKEASSIRNPRN